MSKQLNKVKIIVGYNSSCEMVEGIAAFMQSSHSGKNPVLMLERMLNKTKQKEKHAQRET